MSRVAVRTVFLNRDIVIRAITVFGTIKNLTRQLGLERQLPYLTVYNAFQHLPIRPEHKDLIEDSWRRWVILFLRPEVPVSDYLAVTDENRATNPSWLKVKGKR